MATRCPCIFYKSMFVLILYPFHGKHIYDRYTYSISFDRVEIFPSGCKKCTGMVDKVRRRRGIGRKAWQSFSRCSRWLAQSQRLSEASFLPRLHKRNERPSSWMLLKPFRSSLRGPASFSLIDFRG